jgi:hypothetical protein
MPKTEKQIRALVHADSLGSAAAHEGKKIDANPYPEADETHWRWLNAWCAVMERKHGISPANENSAGTAAHERKTI